MASTYSAIYSFGDSLSDAGDAYLLTNSVYASLLGVSPEPVSPPYDQESYGGVKADVFSNGQVWVQDLAYALGLPNPGPGQVGATGAQLAAAGISPFEIGLIDPSGGYVTLVPAAPNGTDFAIGGSVTGPNGFNPPMDGLTDLTMQLDNFKQQAPAPAADALYTVWSGSNDVLDLLGSSTFASQSATISQNEVATSAQNVVNLVVSLSGLGAQTILVGNLADLGLTPDIVGTAVSGVYSAYAQFFNMQLTSDLRIAAPLLTKTTVDLLDNYDLLAAAKPGLVVPGVNGGTITNVVSPAYTGSYTNDPLNSEVSNPDNYLYFDQLHPTQTGHQAIANLAEADLAANCYAAGTRIRTPDGDVPIEALREGDAVLTAFGAVRPIRWLGRRSYAGRFLLGAQGRLPIRFAAGCLGAGLPERDLLVSPEHGMAVDGWLAPAAALLNGTTITRAAAMDSVHYVHVELDSHDLLLAEGTPTESYVDEGNRASFHNAADRHGEPAGASPRYCLPRLTDGPELEAIRRRLRGRLAA